MNKEEILKMNKEEIRTAARKVQRLEESSGCSDYSDCSYCYDYSDCSYCSDCYGCFDCSGCSGCSGCSYCFDCSYCSDCSGCFDCFSCFNLRSKQYHILNIKLTKEEYEKKIKELKGD